MAMGGFPARTDGFGASHLKCTVSTWVRALQSWLIRAMQAAHAGRALQQQSKGCTNTMVALDGPWGYSIAWTAL